MGKQVKYMRKHALCVWYLCAWLCEDRCKELFQIYTMHYLGCSPLRHALLRLAYF
jgi:hypothetical protein